MGWLRGSLQGRARGHQHDQKIPAVQILPEIRDYLRVVSLETLRASGVTFLWKGCMRPWSGHLLRYSN